MTVLVLGAGGFIGRHIAARLIAHGISVTAAGRDPLRLARMLPSAATLACDLMRDDADVWTQRLVGVEALINCAGVLGGDYGVHDRGARALFDGARRAGVGRIIQISALGADVTSYQRSKHAADAHLAALGGDGAAMGWAVLRPSLVLGRGGASMALFTALAALPVVPSLGAMGQVQPILVDDLVEAVVRLLRAPLPLAVQVDVVGPDPMGIDDVTTHLRRWLGLGPGLRLPVPGWALRWVAALGIGPVTRESLTMLRAGNTASVAPFIASLGFHPQSVAQGLALHPATRGDLVAARIAPLVPVLRWLLALIWLAGGIVSLLAPATVTSLWLARAGLTGLPATVALWAGSLADLALGLAVIARRRGAALAGIGLMASYTAILTRIAPELWADPFGPLVKNLAVLGLSLALWCVETNRG